MENTTEHLFAVAMELDRQIDYLERNANSYELICELSDLKAYRIHIQDAIEKLVSQAENQLGE